MNNILTQIKNRKSVRVFEDRPIDSETKKQILSAAFEAPTAGAMMLYTILDITDQSLKDQLADLCDHQPFIAKAPMVLIFLADYQRWYDTYCYAECDPRTPGEGDILLASADALIAAQNTVVAAESLGVGSCYIGDIIENCESIREVLTLPDYVLPIAMLVYGYPTESQKNRKKPARFEEQYIVFENNYKRLSKEEHEQMHASFRKRSDLTPMDFQEAVRDKFTRKYMSDFAKEMNRSAGEHLKRFRS